MAGHCFGFVEDEPSACVLKKLVAHRNRGAGIPLQFRDGFPAVKKGFGNIRKQAQSYVEMARKGLRVIVVVDLDTTCCAPTLLRDWFSIRNGADILLPESLAFRVAVREIESWIVADRACLARYMGIPSDNFPRDPDALPDPKQELLNVIRRKGRRSWHREMLPHGPTASIGPAYNERLCDFIEQHWEPERAARNSSSLRKAMDALSQL